MSEVKKVEVNKEGRPVDIKPSEFRDEVRKAYNMLCKYAGQETTRGKVFEAVKPFFNKCGVDIAIDDIDRVLGMAYTSQKNNKDKRSVVTVKAETNFKKLFLHNGAELERLRQPVVNSNRKLTKDDQIEMLTEENRRMNQSIVDLNLQLAKLRQEAGLKK